jgi:BTB/POZ domain
MATRKQESNEWIHLNVGGRMLLTTRHTLTTREPKSMLARLAEYRESGAMLASAVDPASGALLLDRDPRPFQAILSYLRHGSVVFRSLCALAFL